MWRMGTGEASQARHEFGAQRLLFAFLFCHGFSVTSANCGLGYEHLFNAECRIRNASSFAKSASTVAKAMVDRAEDREQVFNAECRVQNETWQTGARRRGAGSPP